MQQKQVEEGGCSPGGRTTWSVVWEIRESRLPWQTIHVKEQQETSWKDH